MVEIFEPLQIPETRSVVLEVLDAEILPTTGIELADQLLEELREHPQHLMTLMQILAQSSYKAWKASKEVEESKPIAVVFPETLRSSGISIETLSAGEEITETFEHEGEVYTVKINYEDKQSLKVYIYDSDGSEAAIYNWSQFPQGMMQVHREIKDERLRKSGINTKIMRLIENTIPRITGNRSMGLRCGRILTVFWGASFGNYLPAEKDLKTVLEILLKGCYDGCELEENLPNFQDHIDFHTTI